MAGSRVKRSIGTAIALLGVLAGVAYCVDENERTAGEKAQSDRETEAARKTATSVSVLPPGIEDAWLAYVDTRIATTMKREGNTVQVSPYGDVGLKTYISVNMPYKITCFFSARVDFGVGKDDDKDTAFIYNMLGPLEKEAPALAVDPSSIAARTLDEVLCRKVVDRVQAIMSPDKTNPIQK